MLAEAIITNKEKGFVFVCHCCTLIGEWICLFAVKIYHKLSYSYVAWTYRNIDLFTSRLSCDSCTFMNFQYEFECVDERLWSESPNSTPHSSKHISNSLSIPSCTRLSFLVCLILVFHLLNADHFLTIWSSYFSWFLLEVLPIWSLQYSHFSTFVSK